MLWNCKFLSAASGHGDVCLGRIYDVINQIYYSCTAGYSVLKGLTGPT